jgi:iron complex outermembrane receptor protein
VLRELLKINVFLIVGLCSMNTFSQHTTDSLKPIVVSSSQTPPNSYKKQAFDLSLNDNLSISVASLLEKKSTIYIKNYGKGQLSSVSVRGTGASQTQLYWNGFKMNSPTLGQTDLSLLPTFFIDDAQLNYGHSSLVDGSGGLGGSIQLNNKLKFTKGIGFSIGQEVASFGNYTTTAQLKFGNAKWQHQFKGMFLKGDNDFKFQDLSQIERPIVKQKNNEVNQYGVQYEGGYKISSNDLIRATVYYFNSDRNLPAIIGGGESKQNQTDENLKSFLEWKSYRNNYTGNLKLSFFKEKMNYTDSVSRIFSETNVNTFQGQYKLAFEPIKNVKIEPIIQAAYNEVNADGDVGVVNRLESSILLKFEHSINKFSYDVMLRQGVIDETINPFVFGIGGNYTLLKDDLLNVKMTGSKNYRYPTLNDLYWNPGGNLNLKAETGWSGEFGFESKIKKHSFSLLGFYGVIDNWIQWQPANGNLWTPVNLKLVENKGVELDYTFINKLDSALVNWEINLGYAYTSSINKKSLNESDNTIGKMLIYVPKHKISATGSLIIKSFKISYTQFFTSKVYIDASNSVYLPYYLPARLSISKPISFNKNTLSLNLAIDNLYNEPYQVVANRPIPGVNYTFSLRYVLN